MGAPVTTSVRADLRLTLGGSLQSVTSAASQPTRRPVRVGAVRGTARSVPVLGLVCRFRESSLACTQVLACIVTSAQGLCAHPTVSPHVAMCGAEGFAFGCDVGGDVVDGDAVPHGGADLADGDALADVHAYDVRGTYDVWQAS